MKVKNIKNTKGVYSFFCPACKTEHEVWTTNEGYEPPAWRINYDLSKPTFEPSICITKPGKDVCHSFVTMGKIQYLSDCTHNMAGQIIDLPEL